MYKIALKKCLSLVCFTFFVSFSFAQQLSDYRFSSSAGTYSDMVGGIAVPGLTSNNNAISTEIMLSFPFVYQGNTYTFMKVSTAGFIVLGTSGSASGTVNDLAQGQATQISPLWDNHTIVAANITYQTSGLSPNRVMTIQWKNFQWNTDTIAQSNMQLRLYENNAIEFIYGALTPDKSTKPSSSIGLNGDCGSAFLSVTPGTPTASTSTANNGINSASGLASGTTYKFTPYITSISSGSWSSPATWSSGSVPTITSKVIVLNGHTVSIPDNYTAECQRLVIGSEKHINASTQTAIVNLAGAASKLLIQGDQFSEGLKLSMIDVITVSDLNTADYAVLNIGNGTLDLTGNIAVDGIQHSSTGTANMRSVVTLGNGTMTVKGSIRRSSRACTVSGQPAISAFIKENSIIDLSGGAGTLNITGDIQNGINLILGTGQNTVNYNGTSLQTIYHPNFNNLKINGAGVSCDLEVTAQNITIGDINPNASFNDNGKQLRGSSSGKLEIKNAGTLILGSATVATQFPLNFQTQNIILSTTSTINYHADQLQTIKPVSYGSLTFSKSTSTAVKNISFPQEYIINGNLSFQNGSAGSMTFEYNLPGTATQVIGGNLNIDGATFKGNTGSGNITYSIGGKISQTGSLSSFTANEGSGSVTINAGGSYTCAAGPVTISNGQGPVNMIVGKEFSLTGGNFTGMTAASGGTAVLTVTDSVIQKANFMLNEGPGTATFNVLKGSFVKKYDKTFTVNNGAGQATLDIQTGGFRTDTLGQRMSNVNGTQITISNGTGKGTMHVKDRFFKNDRFGTAVSGVLVVSNSAGTGELFVDGEFYNKGGDFYGSINGNSKMIFGSVNREKGTNFIVNKGTGSAEMSVTGNFTNTISNIYVSKHTGAASLIIAGVFDKKAGLLVVTDTTGKGTFGAGTFKNVTGDVIGSNTDTGHVFINITGDLDKSAGIFTLNNNDAKVAVMTVGGNLNNTAGDFFINKRAGNGSLTVNGNLTKVAGNLNVNQGSGQASLTVLRNLTNNGGDITGSSNTGKSSIYVGLDVLKTNGNITVSNSAAAAEFIVDGKLTNNAGDLRIANSGGNAKLIVKGDLIRNTTSPFVISGGAGSAVLDVSGSFQNMLGDLTVSSSTGNSKVNILGDLLKTAGNFTLSSSDGDVYFKVGGKFTNKAGNLTLSSHMNGADTLIVIGDFMKEAGSVIVSNSGNNNVKLDVGGLFTNQTGDFTASNVKGAPVVKFGSFKLDAGNFFGSKDNAAPVTGKPQITITNDLEIAGGIFYGCDDNESEGPDKLIYTIGGNLKQSGGTFIGTADKSANEFTVGGNATISGGDFICAQLIDDNVLDPITIGNPVFTINGNLVVDGGNLVMAESPANPPVSVGGVAQLNIGGSFVVNSGSFTAVNGYTAPVDFGDYDGQIIFKNKLAGAPASTDTIRLSTGLEADQTSAYSITIENQRTLAMKSDIELGTDKFMTVNGNLITGAFIVRNTTGSASSGTAFTLANNAAIDIGSVNGITTSGSTGSVQTNTRTYNTAASYKYSFAGTGTVTGNGLPATVRELIVNTPVLAHNLDITVTALFAILADNQVLRMTGGKIIKIDGLATMAGFGKKRFVEGSMSKVFAASAQEFIYPLGVLSGTDYFYRPLGITPSNPLSATLRVDLKKTTTSTLYPVSKKETSLDGVNNNYYHELRVTGGLLDKSVSVSMQYDPTESGINSPGMVTIARYKDGTDTAGRWRDMNAVMSANDTTLFITPFITPNKFVGGGAVNPLALAGKDRSDNYAPLDADFYVDKQNPCVGDTIVFTSTSTGQPETYSWEFGPTATPATFASAGPVKVVYNSSGTKTIKLTVTKGAAIKSYTMSNYIVGTTNDITPPIQGASESCKGDTLLFYVVAATPTDTFSWTANNSAQIISGQNTDSVLIRFTKGGNTSVTARKTNNITGCTATTSFKNINVRTTNISAIVGETSGCENGNVKTYSVDDHVGSQYAWSIMNGTIQSGQNTNQVQVKWTTAGTGEIRVTETITSSSCSESDTLQVYISNILIDTSDDTTICYGQSASLLVTATGSSQGDYIYSWRPADKLSDATIANPVALDLTETTKFYADVRDGSCAAIKTDSVTVTVLPAITAAVPQKIVYVCTDNTVKLNVNASGGMHTDSLKYEWTNYYTNDFVSSLKSPSVNVDSTTTYRIRVYDNCSPAKFDTVRVITGAPLSAVVSPDTTVCYDAQVNLRVNPIGGSGSGSYSYQWTSKPAGFNSQLQNPAPSPVENTVYYISITDDCSPVYLDSVQVTVGQPVTVAVIADTTICEGSTVQMVTNGAGGSGPLSYSWSPATGLDDPNIANPVATPSVSTNYTVTVSDGCSPVVTESVFITVQPKPAADAGVDRIICPGQTTQIGTIAVSGMIYSWTSSPAGFTSSDAIVDVSPSENTVYYLLVSNQNGCTNVDSVVVNLHPVIADAGTDKTNCSGEGAAIGTPALSGYTYSWTSNPAGFTSSNAQSTVYPVATTVYYLTVTSPQSCVKTDSVSITVGQNPVADGGPEPTICPGNPTQIGTPPLADHTYSWTSKPAGFTSSDAQTTVSPSMTTMYYLTVTNGAGCKAVDSVLVQVQPEPIVDAGTDKGICPGGTAQIGTPALAGYTYTWSSVSDGFISSDAEITVTPDVTTIYYLDAISPDGCLKTDSVEVKIDTPTTDAGTDKNSCKGSAIQIGMPAVAGYTYSWTSNPAGFTSSNAQPIVNPDTTTRYYLSVTTLSGCVAIDSAEVLVNEVPVADAGSDRSICPGNNTQLGIPAVAGNTYSWTSNPAGFTSASAEPAVNPSSGTMYYLTVSNAAGCTTLDSVLITMNPVPVAEAGADATICEGSSAQLNATGGTAYSWTPATGLSNTSIADPVASPTATTMYYVSASNAEGCKSVDSVLITVNPAPVADAGTDKSICIGDNTQIGTPGIAGNTYSWTSNPAGFTSADAELTISPSANTTYYLSVASLQGCTKTDSVLVTVNPVPNAEAGSDATICAGGSTQLNATGGASYSWTPSTGLSNAAIANPVASPTVTTRYYVTVSNGGCSSIDSVLVTVNSAPVANAGPDKLICKGSSVQIGTPAVGGNTYSWTSSPAGFASAIAQPTVNPSVSTTYYLMVTNLATCTKIDSVVVAIDNIDAQFSYTPAAPMANHPVNFSSSASVGAVSYAWDFGDPASGTNNTSALPNPSHVYTQDGIKNVRLIVTSANNCKDTLIQSVNMLADGLESGMTATMNVYPNPTTGKVSLVTGSEAGTWVVTVRDIHGKVLYSQEQFIDAQIDLDLTNLSDGLYFIEMKGKQGIKLGKVQIVQ